MKSLHIFIIATISSLLCYMIVDKFVIPLTLLNWIAIESVTFIVQVLYSKTKEQILNNHQ